ncbi:hypothetical protein LCGC14_1367840 [marine sediment metagenome]|uniref:Uncharacterized protein n=1 Tax=marine sediment metagenome TaxID=412755 RepID=A0A0F9K6K5_9ZZZZ
MSRQHKYIIGSKNAETAIYHIKVYTDEELHSLVVEAIEALIGSPGWTRTTEMAFALEVSQWLYKHYGFTQRRLLRIQGETRWDYDGKHGTVDV